MSINTTDSIKMSRTDNTTVSVNVVKDTTNSKKKGLKYWRYYKDI